MESSLLEQISQPPIQENYEPMEPLHLSGTTLEGGGQLVRLAACLSAILQYPVHVKHIRGNRSGKTGLKGSHIEALEFLTNWANAKAKGLKVGSREIWLSPSLKPPPRRVVHMGSLYRIQLRQAKPGSIFLIMQAILPFCIWGTNRKDPILLKITGGTNASFSPSFEYVQQVLLPVFERIGLPPIKLSLIKRGWTHGPIEIGEVDLDMHTLEPGKTIPAFNLTNRGKIIGFDITILAHSELLREAIRQEVVESLKKRYPDIDQSNINIVVDEDSGHYKRLYLLVVAKGENGERLGRDCLYDRKFNVPNDPTSSHHSNKHNKNNHRTKYQAPPPSSSTTPSPPLPPSLITSLTTNLVTQVLDDLSQEINHSGAVDTFTADQLVVFGTLCEGRSVIDAGSGQKLGTLHTQTVRWVVEQFLQREKGGGYRHHLHRSSSSAQSVQADDDDDDNADTDADDDTTDAGNRADPSPAPPASVASQMEPLFGVEEQGPNGNARHWIQGIGFKGGEEFRERT